MRAFWSFVRSVLAAWVALVTGVASFGISVWLDLTGAPAIESGVLRLIAGLALLYSFFAAWRSEHRQVQALGDRYLPKLIGEIQQLVIPASKEGEPAFVVIILTIKNLGADSIVENYWVTATVGNREIPGTLHVVPDPLVLKGASGGAKTYHAGDSLLEKTMTQPVVRGSQVIGLLLASFAGAVWHDPDQASFSLGFSDVTGRPYVVAVPAETFPGSTDHHFAGLSD